MFTLDQIHAAHALVQSGADFPRYVSELKRLGVRGYTYWVVDGHTEYHGHEGLALAGPARGDALALGPLNAERFADRLKLHQAGGTTFPQFCADCANQGVDRWVLDFDAMTCTYFSAQGTAVLVEVVPEAP